MNKIVPITLAVAIVCGGVGFYGGMLYQKSQRGQAGRFSGNPANFESPAANNNRRTGGLQGGFASGEIVSKDNNSITLKLGSGGTRIVFYSGSTQITKQASGSAEDLAVGSPVMVQGSSNSDGSVAATTISLRPAGSMPGRPDGNPGSATGTNPLQ
ncbi:MAG: DUF5666 domain-containing protein [Candidatus Pacebacteria bacterium]|jgi:hypothetical protein|nr:DUF5666 domain-containing protein [Candidatus Paceibacterota bacterium]